MLGYTTQANFLINCGIAELLLEERDTLGILPGLGAGDATGTTRLLARGAVNVLISPNEMGELFKVIALGRGVPGPLVGFSRGDRVHAL